MSILFRPFEQQQKFLLDKHRIKGAFSGKRGGKTEVGAVQGIMYQEGKPDYTPSYIDPYLGIIIAPTNDMLRRLSLKKFMAYAKGFIASHDKSKNEIKWHDGSEVYCISAERPERLEGVKANWIWIDEVFQVSEQLFLEAQARIADQKGYLICTGSLGVQYVNPKLHWAYKHFKETPREITASFEWGTAENPHFPKDELEDLKNNLDIRTYKQMFEIDWNTTPESAVYNEFSEINQVVNYTYNPKWPTYVSIDWGWAHPMACLFFQHDKENDRIYLFDEIVGSRITLDDLYARIIGKNYKIAGWCCDIAGNQEREQSGISNVDWFKNEKKIELKFTSSAIQYGLPLVRSYIKSANGVVKFFIVQHCKKSIDAIKNYRYPVKDGIVLNENPIKQDDDPVDAIRYFFVNFLDKNNQTPKVGVKAYA